MQNKLMAFYLYVSGKGVSDGIFFPVWILFLRQCGLSYIFIGVIGVLLEIARVVFEIPCGAFADTYGKDKSLLASSGFHALAFILMSVSQSVEAFAIVAVVFGIGDAFHSGAYEAWLMDYLEIDNRQCEFKRRLTASLVIMYSLMVISSLAAGHLYVINYRYILTIPIFANILSFYFALSLRSGVIKRGGSSVHLAGAKVDEIRRHMSSAFGVLIRSKKLILFMIVVLFTEWALDGIERFYQPFLVNELISPAYISYLYGFSAMLGIVMLLFENNLSNRLRIGELHVLIAVKALIVCVCVLAVMFTGWWSYACISIFFGLHYLISPSSQTYLNRLVPSESRTTCLSIYSLVGASGEILAGITIGIVAQYRGAASAILISSLCLIPALAVLSVLNRRDRTLPVSESA